MRHERTALRIAVHVPVARKTADGIRQPVGQVATRRVESDAREHGGIHHLGARLDVVVTAHCTLEILAYAVEGLAASASENGFAPCDTGRAMPARDSTARIQARGDRLERMAHAVEAVEATTFPGKVVSRRVDQRDGRDQPARDDAGLRVQ